MSSTTLYRLMFERGIPDDRLSFLTNEEALVNLTGDKYQRVRDSQDPIAASIIANYRVWAASDPKGASNMA